MLRLRITISAPSVWAASTSAFPREAPCHRHQHRGRFLMRSSSTPSLFAGPLCAAPSPTVQHVDVPQRLVHRSRSSLFPSPWLHRHPLRASQAQASPPCSPPTISCSSIGRLERSSPKLVFDSLASCGAQTQGVTPPLPPTAQGLKLGFGPIPKPPVGTTSTNSGVPSPLGVQVPLLTPPHISSNHQPQRTVMLTPTPTHCR